ncbi:MAG: type III pantothenate kinase [Actinomycetota bacterium]
MLLAIDVGNTHTVVGLYDLAEANTTTPEAGLLDHWRVATNAQKTADEHALTIQEFLGFHGFSFTEQVMGAAISSVVPSVTMALREMVERYFGFRPVVVGPGVRSGMPILYENPREVGADRIVNAVAAYDLYGGPAIVVDFGTATTFDAISAKGEYLGGTIVPGVEISLEALFQRASALRRVELVEPRNVVGRSTIESIQSGVLFGTAAMLDGLVERIELEIGESTVVATGGLAVLIAPLVRRVDHHEPWLTLHGLRLVHSLNVDDQERS